MHYLHTDDITTQFHIQEYCYIILYKVREDQKQEDKKSTEILSSFIFILFYNVWREADIIINSYSIRQHDLLLYSVYKLPGN